MKSIGEKAKAFREARGWSYTRMAAEVSKHSAHPISRQAITQLEEVGCRKPHYIVALAAVMGVSTDSLLTGAVQQHASTLVATGASLALTLENLSSYLVEMDATTRHRVGFLLADLADNPDHHAQIAAMLEAAGAPRAPVREATSDEGSRRLVVWSEQFRAEQQRKQDVARRKRKEG